MPIDTVRPCPKGYIEGVNVRFPTYVAVLVLAMSMPSFAQSSGQVSSMLITHGSCPTDCAVYSVRLSDDGLITYRGQGFVKVFGEHSWMVPAGNVESIFRRLKEQGFVAADRPGKFLTDHGACEESSPAQTTTVVLTVDDKEEPPIPACYSESLRDLVLEAEHVADVSIAATGRDDRREAAIRAVLDEQVAAWNKGDIDGFMRGYWMSKDLTFFSGGTETHGWKETLERYRKSYKSAGKEMGQLTFGDLRIEMLSTDSAFVRGTWKLTMKDGKTPHGLFTLIFRKMPDGWRIVHDSTGSA